MPSWRLGVWPTCQSCIGHEPSWSSDRYISYKEELQGEIGWRREGIKKSRVSNWLLETSRLKACVAVADHIKKTRRGGRRAREELSMLILELGIWVLPFTLLLAPARQMVRLVDELQRIFLVVACGGRRRPTFGEVWSRLDRLDSATVIA